MLAGGSVASIAQLLVDIGENFVPRGIDGVGVDVDPVTAGGQLRQSETIAQEHGEIVGAELQPTPEGDEMVREGCVPEPGEPGAELLQGAGLEPEWNGHVDRFAKIEGLEGG